MITVDFLITSLIVVLIPGTGVVYTVSTGLVRGKRASVYAALGCTVGIVPHLLATVVGLAAVLHMSALAFQLLKFAGMAYLFYLAYATWRDKQAFAVDARAAAVHGSGIAIKAFLINILNPKLSIFFLAFLPQFVAPDAESRVRAFLFLGALFIVNGTLWCLFLAWAASAVNARLRAARSSGLIMKRAVGAMFVGLGVRLAVSK